MVRGAVLYAVCWVACFGTLQVLSALVEDETRELRASVEVDGDKGTCPDTTITKQKLWKTWKSSKTVSPEFEFFPKLKERKSVGFGFGGGGERASILTMGYLRALRKLDFLKKAAWMSTSSGGAWAATQYAYYQYHTEGETKIKDLDKYLGLTREYPPNSSEELESMLDFPFSAYEKSSENRYRSYGFKCCVAKRSFDASSDWKPWIKTHVFDQVGIDPAYVSAFNEDHKDCLQKRLPDSTIVVPQPNTPLLTMGCAVFGPHHSIPLAWGSPRPYTSLLVTPLYVGSAKHAHRTFTTRSVDETVRNKRPTTEVTVGGFVETVAFGNHLEHTRGDKVQVDLKDPFDLGRAVTCASFAFASKFVQYGGGWSMTNNYFPPDEPASIVEDMVVGDGGIVENVPLIELIQRGARCPIIFGNFAQGLKKTYHPKSANIKDVQDPAPLNQDTIAFFFNIGNQKSLELYNYGHNVVFDAKDWPTLINQLQAKQEATKTMIATMRLKTVKNEYWGIEKDQEVVLTYVYNSRSIHFLKALFPQENIRKEKLKDWDYWFDGAFPLANTGDTTFQAMSREHKRLLYLHASMVVMDNQETFRRATECSDSLGLDGAPW